MRGDLMDEVSLHARFRDHRLHGEWFDHVEPISSYISKHATPWLAKTYRKFLPPPVEVAPRVKSEAERLKDEADHAAWLEAINAKRREGLEKFRRLYD